MPTILGVAELEVQSCFLLCKKFKAMMGCEKSIIIILVITSDDKDVIQWVQILMFTGKAVQQIRALALSYPACSFYSLCSEIISQNCLAWPCICSIGQAGLDPVILLTNLSKMLQLASVFRASTFLVGTWSGTASLENHLAI